MKWPGVTATMRKRGQRPPDYGRRDGKNAWRGPVTRLDDLSDMERVKLGAWPRGVRPPSEILIARCTNWTCRNWRPRDAVRCPYCHERQTA